MNLEKLYDLAEKEDVKIYDFYFDEDINGMYLNYNKLNAIALNYKVINNSQEEKCILSEELGHYYMDATYPASTKDKILIDKQEYKAKKWSYYILIPFEKLKSAISNGIDTLYSLAEYFEVTEEYMKNAINFYQSKYGLIY